ncbi:hypothetical protein ABGT15_01625 [Flavobacterium enshiense]|uniref:hypothetical protein n=1 Tax=Flavobacterium enshiense TaxID=1341165 RepID=UPI00345DD99D
MRKLIYAFSALALLFASCSSDSDSGSSSDNSSGNLLKKTVTGAYVMNFNYNGTKLVSAIDNDSEEVDLYFTYTGDNITKIEYKTNDGTVDQIDNYNYNSEGKLISYVRLDPGMDWGNKEVYTYNADGTVSVEHYIGDTVEQTQLNNTGKIFFTNGEVTKIEEYEGGVTTSTIVYTHDSANGAMKNITGMGKIAFAGGYADSIAHNILTEVSSVEGTITNVYTYNSANYPVICVTTDIDGEETTQFFYE